MIHFSNADWDRVRNSFENWWNKKSDCAIVGAMVKRYAPSEKTPSKPILTQNNVHLGFTADEILDTIEYDLSQYEFIGDAFPMYSMVSFGPGVVAEFLGCKADNNNGTTGIWFKPGDKKFDIENFNPVYDGDNPTFKRIRQLFRRSVERFDGKILLSMPDLGGVADVLSSFFPGEELLFAMYDDPEYVKEAINKLDALWQKFYDDFAKDLNCQTFGYTDWSGTLSKTPSYVVQSDISYMLSHEMYLDFIKDSIQRHCNNLDRTLYHLDGVGELKNLDDLLTIDNLTAVQWALGSNNGRQSCYDWMEVYNKILSADKLAQIVWTNFEDLEKIVRSASKKGYIQQSALWFDAEHRDYAVRSIEKIKSL